MSTPSSIASFTGTLCIVPVFSDHHDSQRGHQRALMDLIEEQLSRSKTIAVVGPSPDPDRPSDYVAKYLQEQGFRVIPVNSVIDEALGQKSYPDLKSIPEEIDMVDIFRRSELVGPVVDEARSAVQPVLSPNREAEGG